MPNTNIYTHKHHIIPKHMGGTDDPSNIVELTIEEHAEAHRVLYEKYGRREDKLAWKGLAGLMSKKEILREVFKGKKHTEEHKQHMSKVMSGENNPMYGREFSKEHRQKMSKSQRRGSCIKCKMESNYTGLMRHFKNGKCI